MKSGWKLGDGGVLVCRCAQDFSAHALALAAQREWRQGEAMTMAFAWLLELPARCMSAWQRYELAAVFRRLLTARTLPAAVVVQRGDEDMMRRLAWDLAHETGGVLGVFCAREGAQEWASQQALAFIGESCWRVRELASMLHTPVLRPSYL